MKVFLKRSIGIIFLFLVFAVCYFYSRGYFEFAFLIRDGITTTTGYEDLPPIVGDIQTGTVGGEFSSPEDPEGNQNKFMDELLSSQNIKNVGVGVGKKGGKKFTVTFSQYAKGGEYKITDMPYTSDMQLLLLNTEITKDKYYVIRKNKVVYSTYLETELSVPQSVRSFVEVGDHNIELYMGYIILYTDEGQNIYTSEGDFICSFIKEEMLVPALTRDLSDRPLFYHPLHGENFVYIGENGEIALADYDDEYDNRGLYFDYPAWYGRYNEGDAKVYEEEVEIETKIPAEEYYGENYESYLQSKEEAEKAETTEAAEDTTAEAETDAMQDTSAAPDTSADTDTAVTLAPELESAEEAEITIVDVTEEISPSLLAIIRQITEEESEETEEDTEYTEEDTEYTEEDTEYTEEDTEYTEETAEEMLTETVLVSSAGPDADGTTIYYWYEAHEVTKSPEETREPEAPSEAVTEEITSPDITETAVPEETTSPETTEPETTEDEGDYVILKSFEKRLAYGYYSWNIVTSFRYKYLYAFSEELGAGIMPDGRMLFINIHGWPVITGENYYIAPNGRFCYSIYAEPFLRGMDSLGCYYYNNGYVRVQQIDTDSFWGNPDWLVGSYDYLIDDEGKRFESPDGYRLVSYSDGILLLERDGYYGYYSVKGEWIAQPIFTYARPFFEGIGVIGFSNGIKGAIDTEGNVLVPFEYSYISHPSSGVIALCDYVGNWSILLKTEKIAAE